MFKKIIPLFLIAFIFVCGFSITVNASETDKGYVFDLNYAEPSTGDHQGYICLFTRDSSGVYGIVTYFWNTIGTVNSGYDSPTYAYLTINSNSFKFQVAGGSSTSGFYSITQIGTTGNWWNIKNSSTEAFLSDFGTSRTILGFHYKGNVGTVSGMTMSTNPFTVYFSSDASAIYLRDVWDLIHATYYQNEEIISELEALYSLQSSRLSQVVSWLETINGNATLIDSKLSTLIQRGNDILNEQKKTNTWLEKIYNFFAEKDEKDKEAATQQGNQSTADIDNMIQDDSAGFVDSLGGLTSSMSYTGTNCSWTFPTVKLPAISGVMDEVTLVESQEIDFTYWVNSIPSGILLLVQSVCTVALIVFCFKELYGAISYALTLKGGGNSE